MAQTEYVLVEDPHGPRSRDVPGERAHRPSWRRLLWGAMAVLAAGAVAVIALGDDDAAPAPAPTVTARAVNAERVTALAYAEYLDRKALVDCMSERGYPYEARIVDNDESLASVAALIGVTPGTADASAPIPLLRQPDLYLGRGGREIQIATGSVGCTLERTGVDVSDVDAIAEGVAAAKVDAGFRALVAEQVWVAQHPAEVSQRIALLALDREAPVARDSYLQERWGRALDAVVAALPDDSVWVPVTIATYDGFAQASGITSSGGAIVVRVGERDAPLQVSAALARADAIACGPAAISAAVATPYGDEAELREMMEGLVTGCGALTEAGIVTAETLAEVYFE